MSGSTGVRTRPRPPARTSGPARPGREAIDPRIRARRRAVTRRSSLGRRVTLVAIVALVVLGGLAWPLTHSRLLSANALTVYGAGNTGDVAVLAAAGLATHPPMVDVNTASAARRVEALPWVAHAQVALDWPDGVVVTVSERSPVAVTPDGTGWAELDASGRVLASVATPPVALPHLVSVRRPGAPGTTLAGARPSLAVAAALPVAFKSLVTAVSASPGGAVDIALSNGIGVVFGTATDLPAKFEDVASLLAGAGLASGSVIDVSVPATPLVTPPKASSSASSSSSSSTSSPSR